MADSWESDAVGVELPVHFLPNEESTDCELKFKDDKTNADLTVEQVKNLILSSNNRPTANSHWRILLPGGQTKPMVNQALLKDYKEDLVVADAIQTFYSTSG